jgi:hypothetical protein
MVVRPGRRYPTIWSLSKETIDTSPGSEAMIADAEVVEGPAGLQL